jgi:hypothetical protein
VRQEHLLIHSSYVEMKIRMGGRVDDTFLPMGLQEVHNIHKDT